MWNFDTGSRRGATIREMNLIINGALHKVGENMKEKDFEYPQPDDDPAVAEFKERLIDKELDNGVFDNFLKPKGSFGALAAAEKRLKKEEEN